MHKKKVVEEVAKFIIEQDLEVLGQISLSQIAEKFNINSTYLSRIFNKTMDTKLNFYFLRIKLIKCALIMHQKPTLTIKEIAKISGFSDIDYFNKVFKTHFGKAPTVYSPFK